MKYIEEALTKIMNEYDSDRAMARYMREKRVKEVYEKVPEAEEIDREINRLGIENFGNILKNPSESKKFNEEFEKKLQQLKEKKNKVLTENNIPLDFDEVKYKCEKCLDTGYIDTKKCPCFIKKIVKEYYSISNLGDMLHDFSEFSFDYYSDKLIKKLGMTEKENIKDIYEKAINFCESDETKNMLFCGACGLGKTFLSSCVAKRMMDMGKSVIYLSSTGLFSDYEEYRFGRKKDFEKVIEMIFDADLLIIDDLGAEAENASTVQFLFDIINKRNFMKKKMIISTNLNITGIKNRYTERIVSRIIESFSILTFEGSDIRVQKLKA